MPKQSIDFSVLEWDQNTFKAWMRAMNTDYQEAGEMLDIHWKTVSRYANGRVKISRMLVLACQRLLLSRTLAKQAEEKRRREIVEKVVEQNINEVIADTVNNSA